ncbi:DUF4974 domain-containing protein [Echinicola soli]|uniref:DUF4974 domain-containing protein n=1 Tax=Echinicola soli TaxID=2591634 RepID=A0A514CFZ6_9BACT|nr:FecR family protein [Echinicola soli]QDH78746.1 DUF4974 domain-containing protein [Echinicola soli]
MKKYSEFEIEDFLTDEFFVRWAKSSDKEAAHFWEKWMENNPAKREVVMEAYYVVSSVGYKEEIHASDQEEIEWLEGILKQSRGDEEVVGDVKHGGWAWFRRIAAGVVLFFCAFFGYKMVTAPKRVVPEPIATELIYKENPAGQKSTFKLSDGTVVYLNAKSDLKFPNRFSDSIRMVELTGEAFFEVSEDKERPFIVKTQGVNVKVLGTSFNVKSDAEVAVALVEGKVTVSRDTGGQVHLSPNEMLTYKEDGKVLKSSFDPFEIVGWKDKYLVFREDSFLEVKNKIEKWYGVKIQCARDFQSDWSYTGQYYQESLDRVMEGISATSEFSYQIKDKKVILIPNPK